MKNLFFSFLTAFLCLLFFGVVFLERRTISDAIIHFIQKEPQIIIKPSNEYQKTDTFLFVSNTDSFIPYGYQDLKNIFYTIVNHGWKEFTFYCPSEYRECLNDVKTFSHDQDLLTHINNFVHPYNSFSSAKTVIHETGEVNVSIDYFYTEEEMEQINQKVDEIWKAIITDEMDTETKIKTIHDYIIDHTKYDVERNNHNDSMYHSYIAYGPLFEGYATCNGYTDAMALFLTKMNIPNFKVAKTPNDGENEEGHVWNALYYNGKYVHLDLTWDDPVSNDGKDYLQHKYFLITTEQLKEVDSGEVIVTEHDFKPSIYLELK